ncbi:hypothetical protein PIB30_022269 [Stylosanthes scabra]|uniref:Uncharacterized protein n=1 Tax=Stylosanthes scabra TaxID=79078 RepID=A0ABU6S8M1_9FABA|nr:hypothetical protein [Stylosanthes scabra]
MLSKHNQEGAFDRCLVGRGESSNARVVIPRSNSSILLRNMEKLFEGLGYTKYRDMFWEYMNATEFETDLNRLRVDDGIRELIDYLKMNLEFEFHLYWDPVINQPIVVDDARGVNNANHGVDSDEPRRREKKAFKKRKVSEPKKGVSLRKIIHSRKSKSAVNKGKGVELGEKGIDKKRQGRDPEWLKSDRRRSRVEYKAQAQGIHAPPSKRFIPKKPIRKPKQIRSSPPPSEPPTTSQSSANPNQIEPSSETMFAASAGTLRILKFM